MATFRGPDGTQLHFDELGSDGGSDSLLPLIVLAGGAARHPSYLGDLGGLGASRRLIVPHLRGVGQSPMPDHAEVASFWKQAEDLESLRVHLGLEQLLLVAHSAGTRLANSYAAQFPERVAAMALVTPPAAYLVDVASDTEALIDRRRGDSVFDNAVAAWGAGPDANFDDWLERVAPIGYAAWGPTEEAHARTGETNLAANRAFFSVEAPSDFASRLSHLPASVLVIAGTNDCITGVVQPAALAGLFPAGSFVGINECGHFPWVEQPTAFRAAIDPFLSRHTQR
jgi:pimeloyl-ACP methyl ester carboxylesterase